MIRNWYLLLGTIAATCVGAVLFVSLIGTGRDQGPAIFGLCVGLYGLWSFYLELLGVRIFQDVVSYPVRLGLGTGIFPLFRKSVSAGTVLQASSLTKPYGMKVAYLSGEFGQAKILFDTKGGRDRFFAVVASKFRHIKIFRWK